MNRSPVTPHLASVGVSLPGDPVGNAELGRALGAPEGWTEWIDTLIGIRTRHFARDLGTGEVGWSLADLCTEAGSRALVSSGLEAADLGFLVLCTATPDELLPTTASQVADRLGLDLVPVFQLQTGCSGAAQALDIGSALLAAGHRAGLVVGGELSTRHLDPSRDPLALPTQELVNYVLFGDGAGAAVLTAEPLGEAVALRRVLNTCTGRGREPGQRLGWFGPADWDTDRSLLFEDYKAIEEHVPVMAEEILWELLDLVGWEPGELDFVLPPQLSGRMTRLIADRLGVPEVPEVNCVEDTGNTGNALPFHQLHRLLPRLEKGQRALSVIVESSKWIKAGLALEKV